MRGVIKTKVVECCHKQDKLPTSNFFPLIIDGVVGVLKVLTVSCVFIGRHASMVWTNVASMDSGP
jgi:hypothetical protein